MSGFGSPGDGPAATAPTVTEAAATKLSRTEIETVFLDSRPALENVIRRRVGDREQAADLVQDLYLRLNRLADRLPSVSEARFYLLRMAHNIGKDHVRITQNRARLLEGLALLYDVPLETQEELLERRQKIARVEVAMTRLTERQSDMLRRSRILGQDYRTISAEWKVSISTVEQEIARALRHLRTSLRDGSG
ncbi:RNA polymerase sigma-70 factor, ECF subfamily [Novosphingobium sp. CF614]|uniref:RNA polymerase sigma factor n=1 Tax=Novosphingobium sp. CF614 TaxID=1884364 RepID=UPI0008F0E23A|nr:sigma-70 family RNA polymerase sigma factor [Novosphingobium sp. CF614]SFF92345.1 RNA polymerase sigma-70 factor, ECF subfamily [Novosphingobium sp. CF614]